MCVIPHFVYMQPTRKEQAAALLELLLCKDNRAYISFYNALIRESYGDLAGLLHSDLPQLSPEGEKTYNNGISSSGRTQTPASYLLSQHVLISLGCHGVHCDVCAGSFQCR